MQKIQGRNDLVKDELGIIHNVNKQGLEAAKFKKQQSEKLNQRLDRIEQILELLLKEKKE